jgi:hypothetical protein
VGSFEVLAPSPQERVQILDQLLGSQGHASVRALPHLLHETTDRLLSRVGVQISRVKLATDLALGKIKPFLPALDLVAKELETVPDMDNPRFPRM